CPGKQIRSSKSSCMEKENRLYSISLGVASFAGWFGRCRNCFISCNVQAISSFSPSFFVGLGLIPVGLTWRGWLWYLFIRHQKAPTACPLIHKSCAESWVIFQPALRSSPRKTIPVLLSASRPTRLHLYRLIRR